MKAELKKNSVNQIIKGTTLFEAGDSIGEIGLVVKGRVRVQSEGINLVLGSGNFLGLCDLTQDSYQATYTAETNLVVYAFPVSDLQSEVRALIKVNKDYAPLMVSTLSKYIREISKILGEMQETAESLFNFIKSAYQSYQEIGKQQGVTTSNLRTLEELELYREENPSEQELIAYYCACADLPSEVQKTYFGAGEIIATHHILEEISLVNKMFTQCYDVACYLKEMANPLCLDDRSLYTIVLQQATMIQHAGESVSDVMSLFDDIIDRVNSLENLLIDKAGIELEIDHEFMEDAYFELLNGTSPTADDGELALVEEQFISTDELVGALDQILAYGQLEPEAEEQFRSDVSAFMALPDKYATDDEARSIRRGLQKVYYSLYKNVFLKDFHSTEETPLVIDLFLRYGFLSEKLVSEEIQEELLTIDTYHSGMGPCKVYDMKEWLTLILKGEKEPSKSEFDLDYEENLRELRKTGHITVEQQEKMAKDINAKFDYEVQNMFRTNHRIVFGQVTAFVPFLFTEGCTSSINRGYLSKDKVNAAVKRLQQIDYSVFYREGLYAKEGSEFAKEYIQQEVFPDIILMPIYGNKSVMWQELSGRRRNSKGRFLLPIFMEGDLNSEMIKLFGRFRWELCRTIQGASWNNIQSKSLTSEYFDFVQFYRKNRELSEDKKEKLKMQIQKSRNNTREVFVIDYENWVKHEAQGGLCLTKPVREIMATYCPFPRELREKVSEQPMFRDAMARFQRERAKKTKEYDLKFKVWEKEQAEVPPEVIETKRFYTEL
ncbi:MAG: cyclic nucleotide-binding domain-containing protein [Butyribacter sp.]|nr:cyclic nucleotide-binding domain-containing protein [bacterium]MDY3854112.1 cyclic nucleotide-binding domain-containing protein [Butyribacter sp.]